MDAAPISRRFRIALLGKGALLLSLGALFGVLLWRLLAGDAPWLVRVAVAGLFTVAGVFLVWASALAFLDAVLGQARRERGATALRSRRSGHSLRLPGGGFAEYILWNPWEPLEPGQRYTVTYGRYSKVLVERPVRE